MGRRRLPPNVNLAGESLSTSRSQISDPADVSAEADNVVARRLPSGESENPTYVPVSPLTAIAWPERFSQVNVRFSTASSATIRSTPVSEAENPPYPMLPDGGPLSDRRTDLPVTV